MAAPVASYGGGGFGGGQVISIPSPSYGHSSGGGGYSGGHSSGGYSMAAPVASYGGGGY